MEEDVGFWNELRGDCSLGEGTSQLETLEEVEVEVEVCQLALRTLS